MTDLIKQARELCGVETDGPWGWSRQKFIDDAKHIIPALADALEAMTERAEKGGA